MSDEDDDDEDDEEDQDEVAHMPQRQIGVNTSSFLGVERDQICIVNSIVRQMNLSFKCSTIQKMELIC
jgi:hypothetical protein